MGTIWCLRKNKKTIILREDLSEGEEQIIVRGKFRDILNIEYTDVWEKVLVLK